MCIVIKGVKQDGTKFRPSDWAYRLLDLDNRYDSNRRCVQVSLHLVACQSSDGMVLHVHDAMRTENPTLYKQIVDFVKSNELCFYEKTHDGVRSIEL